MKFKEYIEENPVIDKQLTKQVYQMNEKSHRDIIHQKIHLAKKYNNIGNNHYHHLYKGEHIYYHHNGTDVKEVSIIEHGSNIQTHAEKGKDGSVSHIHDFMKHHALKHGYVRSDSTHTPGSKHMWKSLIKSNPIGYTFNHIHPDGHKETLTHKNIDNKESNIWGDDKEDHRLEMLKDK